MVSFEDWKGKTQRREDVVTAKASTFRALRPLFDTASFHTCGLPAQGERSARLWTRDAEGAVTMDAKAGW